MDAVLIRHRRRLVGQYLAEAPDNHQDSIALRRTLGLEFWGDGALLAQHDPEKRTT
jgi:hypothetical protein